MENDARLIINDIRIDPSILQPVALQRCALVDCRAACCTGGAWLDADHAPVILRWADAIKPLLPADRRDEARWFSDIEDDADFPSGRCVGTNTVDDPQRPGLTCCVFLRPDRKCALQVASTAHGLGWPGLKPYYCAIYPLYVTNQVLSLDDETPLDFEGGGCQQPAAERRPLFQVYREETILVLGEDGYRQLCEQGEGRGSQANRRISGQRHHTSSP